MKIFTEIFFPRKDFKIQMYLCMTGISSREWYKQEQKTRNSRAHLKELPVLLVLLEYRVWEMERD